MSFFHCLRTSEYIHMSVYVYMHWPWPFSTRSGDPMWPWGQPTATQMTGYESSVSAAILHFTGLSALSSQLSEPSFTLSVLQLSGCQTVNCFDIHCLVYQETWFQNNYHHKTCSRTNQKTNAFCDGVKSCDFSCLLCLAVCLFSVCTTPVSPLIEQKCCQWE